MDSWKYFDVIHRHHTIMNPLDEKRLEELYELIPTRSQAGVLDIGCSKGEMLIRLAEKNEIKGLGVDKSAFCVKEAEKNKRERVPQADLRFLEMDGASINPKPRARRPDDVHRRLLDLWRVQEDPEGTITNALEIGSCDGERAVLA